MQTRRILGIQPLTAEWFAYRWGRITATDVAAILGQSAYKTPLEVWARLTDKSPTPDFEELARKALAGDPDQPFHLRRGRYLEPACMAMYADETHRLVGGGPGLIQDPEFDWLCSTPDGTIEGDELAPGFIEAKAPGHHKARDWEAEVPLEFRIQLQINLRCGDRSWGAVAALLPEDFRFQDQERNEAFLERVIGFVQNWRIRYVLKDVQPPPLRADDKLVRSMLPELVEEMLVLPASAAILAHQDRELQRLESAVKKRRGAVRTALMSIMGRSRWADAGDGCYLKRNTYDVEHKAKEAWTETGRTVLTHVKKAPEAVTTIGPHDDIDIAAITGSLGVASVLDSAPKLADLEFSEVAS